MNIYKTNLVEDEKIKKLEEILKENKNNDFSTDFLKFGLKHTSFQMVISEISRSATDELTNINQSVSHKSQRYVNHKKTGFYTPPFFSKELRLQYKRICQNMIGLYSEISLLNNPRNKESIKKKNSNRIPSEDARAILPMSTNSEIKFTFTGPQLMNLILNYDNHPHPEITNLVNYVKQQLNQDFSHITQAITKKRINKSENELIQELSELENSKFNSYVVHCEDIILEIAQSAAICYRDDYFKWNETLEEKDIKRLNEQTLKSGHLSVREHIMLTIEGILPRYILQQLRRHRISEKTFEDLTHVISNPIYRPKSIERLDEEHQTKYIELINESRAFAQDLIEKGFNPWIADLVLPYGVYQRFKLTTNLRDFEHILNIRLCNRAQKEFQKWGRRTLKWIYEENQELAKHLGPNCYIDKCKEVNKCSDGGKEIRNYIKELNEKYSN